jgi:hypothetical protein
MNDPDRYLAELEDDRADRRRLYRTDPDVLDAIRRARNLEHLAAIRDQLAARKDTTP